MSKPQHAASENTRGLYQLLSNPKVYTTLQKSLGFSKARELLVSERYINPKPGSRVLDIGCGPADMFDLMPEVDYQGFDLNPSYVEQARKRYGDSCRVLCADVAEYLNDDPSRFDVVMAIGVLHHLDDDAADSLVKLAASALKPEGRLITFDTLRLKKQNPIARTLANLDRGRHVRYPEHYQNILAKHFADVEYEIRHDLVKFPWTGIFMKSTLPKSSVTSSEQG